ncbi:MAG: DUF4139 domain-containing protein [Pseudomonadota bacterium]
MKNIILTIVIAGILAAAQAPAGTGEKETTLADQTRLFVTIYNQDMALIKDSRSLVLPKGESLLAFKDVSGRILPETALLTGGSLNVIEQNFEFDLLTPESLLKKFTGETVTVIRTHPETGVETSTPARVLSSAQGVVLEINNAIETGIPGRIAFPYVPDNLRTRPTLTMLVNSPIPDRQDLELSYLTNGLTWKADYIAQINAEDTALDLSGWVTLTNTSMTTYANADLQLVAGDVHMAPEPEQRYVRKMVAMAAPAAGGDAFQQEEMFEYHLYTLNRKTTLRDNQTKQVALLHAENVPCKKQYLLQGEPFYFSQPLGTDTTKLKTGVFMEMDNTKANNLGMPLPKGVIRVYKEDSRGKLQFAGEDRVDHTPENVTVRLKLGNAFDVTAEKKQTDFRKLSPGASFGFRLQSSFEISIKNSKTIPVTVTVEEPVPGEWRITQETHPHTKSSSSRAVWQIPVPAKGDAVLTYTVQTR